MPLRSAAQARDLFYLLTRTDSTIISTNRAQDYLNEALISYWDANVKTLERQDVTFTYATGALAESNGTLTVSTNTQALSVEACFIRASHTRTPLERISKSELERRMALNSAVSTPNAWAVIGPRKGNNFNHDIYLHPRISATVTLEVWFRPSGYGRDSSVSEYPLQDAEWFWMVQMAAARAAGDIGRTKDVQALLQGVPDAALINSRVDYLMNTPEVRGV